MKIFVAGATGATGKLLVRFLLQQDHQIIAVVRSSERLPQDVRTHKNITLVQASLLDLTNDELQELVSSCGAVASCLGHNMTFKGMFGQPRLLVTEACRRLCQAIIANQNSRPVRYVLMNTVGNRNRDLKEEISFKEKLLVGLMRVLLPPQRDNEQAAEYLRREIGQDHPAVEWAAVRPEGLINDEEVSEYSLHPSPTRSAIFDSGITSRINVAHFMARLATDDKLWAEWKGQMPVISNKMEIED